MENKLILFVLIFLSCEVNSPITQENLMSSNWFDRYGNTYRFENDFMEWKPYMGEIWWETEYYVLKDKSLHLTSDNYPVISIINIVASDYDKVVFDKSLQFFDSMGSNNEKDGTFEIFKNQKNIVDLEENLVLLNLEPTSGHFFKGIRKFKLGKDRRVEISYKSLSSVDTSYILEDRIFNNIEKLIQIIPLEDLEEKYVFGWTHGASFDVEIVTNKVSKNIDCRNWFPVGLSNLIQYIDYELDQEKSSSSN